MRRIADARDSVLLEAVSVRAIVIGIEVQRRMASAKPPDTAARWTFEANGNVHCYSKRGE